MLSFSVGGFFCIIFYCEFLISKLILISLYLHCFYRFYKSMVPLFCFLKYIIYIVKKIPNNWGIHKGKLIIVDFSFTIATKILDQCQICAVDRLFHILFSISTFPYKNSYSYFYIHIVLINLINNYILFFILWIHNQHFQEDKGLSRHTKRYVNYYWSII